VTCTAAVSDRVIDRLLAAAGSDLLVQYRYAGSASAGSTAVRCHAGRRRRWCPAGHPANGCVRPVHPVRMDPRLQAARSTRVRPLCTAGLAGRGTCVDLRPSCQRQADPRCVPRAANDPPVVGAICWIDRLTQSSEIRVLTGFHAYPKNDLSAKQEQDGHLFLPYDSGICSC
jgi:hypothetical protein